MSGCCDTDVDFDGTSSAYRRVLIAVIAMNATMFAVESGAGLFAHSMALQADALDFLGDSVTYGISLYVIGKSLRWRARAAMLKGISLGLFGLWILGATAYRVLFDGMPEPFTMGAIGVLALAVNVASAFLLFKFRNGDSNVRSVWLCSRNDAIGNVGVIAAAAAVAWTQSPWPDLAVAAVMAALFLKGAVSIVCHARDDLARVANAPAHGL